MSLLPFLLVDFNWAILSEFVLYPGYPIVFAIWLVEKDRTTQQEQTHLHTRAYTHTCIIVIATILTLQFESVRKPNEIGLVSLSLCLAFGSHAPNRCLFALHETARNTQQPTTHSAGWPPIRTYTRVHTVLPRPIIKPSSLVQLQHQNNSESNRNYNDKNNHNQDNQHDAIVGDKQHHTTKQNANKSLQDLVTNRVDKHNQKRNASHTRTHTD